MSSTVYVTNVNPYAAPASYQGCDAYRQVTHTSCNNKSTSAVDCNNVQITNQAVQIAAEARNQVTQLGVIANTKRVDWGVGFGIPVVNYYASLPSKTQQLLEQLLTDTNLQTQVACLLGPTDSRAWRETTGNLTEVVEFASVQNPNVKLSTFNLSRVVKKAAAETSAIAKCSTNSNSCGTKNCCDSCTSGATCGKITCLEGAPFRTCNPNDPRLTTGWNRDGLTGLAIVLIVLFLLVLFLGVGFTFLWK